MEYAPSAQPEAKISSAHTHDQKRPFLWLGEETNKFPLSLAIRTDEIYIIHVTRDRRIRSFKSKATQFHSVGIKIPLTSLRMGVHGLYDGCTVARFA